MMAKNTSGKTVKKQTAPTKKTNGKNGVGEPPLDTVIKLTDLERLNLVKVETECMNLLLQIRNHDLELEEVKRKFTADLNARSTHRAQLTAMAETKKNEQQATVLEIAEKYNLDPKQMTYDPDSGVLRDLRPDSKAV